MRIDAGLTEAGKNYEAAYAAHYTTKELGEALGLYRDIMTAHPDTPEAGYAHAQIQNIAHAVVPWQELLDAQAELALAHLAQAGPA